MCRASNEDPMCLPPSTCCFTPICDGGEGAISGSMQLLKLVGRDVIYASGHLETAKTKSKVLLLIRYILARLFKRLCLIGPVDFARLE